MTPRAAVAVLLGVGALTTGCTKTLDVVGLRPLSPPATDPLHVVSTPSPELRWESFPRPRDGKVFGPDASRRITDVTYEIRLWRDPFDGMQSDTPADLHGVEHPPVATGLTEAKFVPPPAAEEGSIPVDRQGALPARRTAARDPVVARRRRHARRISEHCGGGHPGAVVRGEVIGEGAPRSRRAKVRGAGAARTQTFTSPTRVEDPRRSDGRD